MESFSGMIVGTVFVPHDGNVVTMIQHVVKAEPLPFVFWYERTYLKCFVQTGTEAHQSADYQVAVGGMVVVSAPFLIAFKPISCHLIEIFSYVWEAAVIVALHIFLHFGEIGTVGENGLWIIIQVVGKGGKSLGCGERPYRTVPFAFAYTVRAELGMAALSCGKTTRCTESFLIGELEPSLIIDT